MPDDFGTTPIEPTQSAKIQRQEQSEAAKTTLRQELSELSMNAYADEAAFNPVTLARQGRFTSLEERIRKSPREESQRSDEKAAIVEKTEEVSEYYQRKNPELHARALRLLRDKISAKDTAEEILRKAIDSYPDLSLADEALDYLVETSSADLLSRIREAKERLNQQFGREVRAGRNIAEQARAFSSEGLGSPTALRDLYRDITGNPREATTLFSELSDTFSFDKLETAINFLLHSMGTDLKAKGPSIARAELHRLMTEARNLLAILWVYRFFKGRMDLIGSAFERLGKLLALRITFELLAKLFIELLKERYPSMDKVLQMAARLGLSAELAAQMIIFTQMRDAVRGVAPKLFRSDQHRHDVLMSYIEALEELEDRLEEEEEKEEEDEEEEEEEGKK